MLTPKQKHIARELYEGRSSEKDLAQKYNITLKRLHNWLNQPEFQLELDKLCRASGRETRCIISRFGPIAAVKLVEMLDSDKPDTVRRTALDMIDRCLRQHPELEPRTSPDEQELSDDQALHILKTLAPGWSEPPDKNPTHE